MQPLIRRELNGLVAVVAHSTRADGDFSPSMVPSRELAERRDRAVSSLASATSGTQRPRHCR